MAPNTNALSAAGRPGPAVLAHLKAVHYLLTAIEVALHAPEATCLLRRDIIITSR